MFKPTLLSLCLLTLLSCNRDTFHIDWVFVEGGSFEQGQHQLMISPKGDTIPGFTSPRRTVTLSDFHLSQHEITVAQFREFCRQTGREMPQPPQENAHGEDGAYEWQDEMPMLATWHEANAFAEWAGGRLPTEAEWEYAAKGGQRSEGHTYSGSSNATEVGWVGENANGRFHPVGQLQPNELGLYDMTGNVSEWVSDWYNPNKDHLVSLTDPQGPPDGEDKISKGASWYYNALKEDGTPLPYGIHMPEVRYQSPPDTRNDGFGFRIAKDN